MKQWVRKLIEQFEIEKSPGAEGSTPLEISEDKATLLFILDLYHKHLIDVDTHPVRKVRETLDRFGKEIANPERASADRALFDLRQWFSSYRIDETTYIQNTFDDFKRIVWDFADQLSSEMTDEKASDDEVKASLDGLREAVESNSIEALRSKSKEFIHFYIDRHEKKSERRQKRLTQVRRSLGSVKKQLMEANQSMRTDHLTGALNRRSFDERLKNQWRMFSLEKKPVSLIILDIDHFKKINDSHGHDLGDFVLKECVQMLQTSFHREQDAVCRIGGEEFAIILPGLKAEEANVFAEAALQRIRKEVIISGDVQIRFTVSMGIAQLADGEAWDQWLKRADTALYNSKNTGRNRVTISSSLVAAA